MQAGLAPTWLGDMRASRTRPSPKLEAAPPAATERLADQGVVDLAALVQSQDEDHVLLVASRFVVDGDGIDRHRATAFLVAAQEGDPNGVVGHGGFEMLVDLLGETQH